MSEIEYSEILDRSNEVPPKYSAENLIDFRRRQAWLIPSSEKEGHAEIKFKKECVIQALDIGNAGSATFEIEVGHENEPNQVRNFILGIFVL
jgi:hypothetical protein